MCLAAPVDNCPLCGDVVEIEPAQWSGGRLKVRCPKCGSYEVGPKLFDELNSLPNDDWQLDSIRESILTIVQPRVISRKSTNIVTVEAEGADKLTKLDKKFLRAKAEGKTTTGGRIVSTGSAGDGTDTAN